MSTSVPHLHRVLISSFTSEMTQEEAEYKFRTPLKDIDLHFVESDYADLNLFEGDTVLIDKRSNVINDDGTYRLKVGERIVFIKAQLRLNGCVMLKINDYFQTLDDYCSGNNDSVCISGKVLPYKVGRFKELQ